MGYIIMAEFQEDMLFKNVSDEDTCILLEIMGLKSKRTKVWTKELRYIDRTSYKSDLIFWNWMMKIALLNFKVLKWMMTFQKELIHILQ